MAGVLDQMTALELNDKLATLPDFTCALCKNYLSAPIILVANIGNVCGLCKKKLDPSDPFIVNSALEHILQQLRIPCKFSKNGCEERVDYLNLNSHHSKCVYRQCVCPLFNFNNCVWQGHDQGK